MQGYNKKGSTRQLIPCRNALEAKALSSEASLKLLGLPDAFCLEALKFVIYGQAQILAARLLRKVEAGSITNHQDHYRDA